MKSPSVRLLVASYVVTCGIVAGCAAEVSPREASPFEPVTISAESVCNAGDTAVASSAAFENTVTLTRRGDELQGRAIVGDVPPGSYDVEVECEDGSSGQTSLQVTDLPGATDTGTRPAGATGMRWATAATLAAGLLSIGVGLIQRRRVRS